MTLKQLAAGVCSMLTAVLPAAQPPADGKIYLADPFILPVDGVYYAYGTSNSPGIPVFSSTDLRTWRPAGRGKAGMALHREDSYGDRWYWAPEIFCHRHRYYMFYTASKHICLAMADSPAGPFRQEPRLPLIPDRECIDISVFQDDDGRCYAFYVESEFGSEIWMAELTDDWCAFKPGTRRFCLRPDLPWECSPVAITEGPCVQKINGVYWLTYSASPSGSLNYCLGAAWASSLGGAWHKGNRPFFATGNGILAPGHHHFFRDNEGRLRIVHHVARSREQVYPRYMVIGEVRFFPPPRLPEVFNSFVPHSAPETFTVK